ncbi:hypothetical protein HNQ77_004241 [Silvibacterium bohemicum]|uniref:Uncharacterized protein n=1 Tax=Silvibacterium bohemicum TaxID=1577686 RepID=A0A841K2W0_9BACT|nr:hypothetical protein [Silvibacterium bohemicum]MBB6146269.1 hypothetical protein [Silvibacterium bohemicum]
MIQLQLRPEVESQIAAEAQSRGLDVALYVEQIIEQHSTLNDLAAQERKQAVESMLSFSREQGLSLGGTELQELIHDGHDY